MAPAALILEIRRGRSEGGPASFGRSFLSASHCLHRLTRELWENPITVLKIFFRQENDHHQVALNTGAGCYNPRVLPKSQPSKENGVDSRIRGWDGC
jgi:hypothetical protein